MATVDDKKIIFSMVGLNKTIQQNNKQVLKNIYLSFFYGQKSVSSVWTVRVNRPAEDYRRIG